MANSKAKFEVRDVLKTIRKSYEYKKLDESKMNPDPLHQFHEWMSDAIKMNVREPNAMTLSTIGKNGFPNARIVLLRDLDGNGFSFFTNYRSTKGKELEQRKACLSFFWIEVARQIKIIGVPKKVSELESDVYFASRPRESQIGAWASSQSTVIKSRKYLEEQFVYYSKKFDGMLVPRPPHWGGYRLKPTKIEFWQGRENRLHDRVLYTLTKKGWKLQRLSP